MNKKIRNLIKGQKLEKGVMRRKAPYDPLKNLDEEKRKYLYEWQLSPKYAKKDFGQPERREGPARDRFLHKLSGQTKTRKAQDGKREFLLHRGHSPDEAHKSQSHANFSSPSGWSTRHFIAQGFGDKHGDMTSAWIHEDHVLDVPAQHGDVSKDKEYRNKYYKDKKYKNQYGMEREIIVGPHISETVPQEEIHKYVKNNMESAKDGNINAKINYQAGQENAQSRMNARKTMYKRERGVHKIIKQEMYTDLEKGFLNTAGNRLKGALAGTAMTAATMMGPNTMAETQSQDKVPAKLEQQAPEKVQHSKDDILDAIKMVESSGGKDTNHAVIKNPNNLNYGTRSSSAYGIMPLTAKDIISKNKDLKEKYGHLVKLDGKNFHEAYHKHPELDRTLASHYYDQSAKNFGHDPVKIGHSWLNGIRGTYKALKSGKDIKNHWHVNKILNALENK